MKKKSLYMKPFLTDVKTLRDRGRKNIGEGGVSVTYKGNVDKAIEILQTVLATEIVCVLRYTVHAIAATGISSEGVKAEFEQQTHWMFPLPSRERCPSPLPSAAVFEPSR
jgi:hypothetical protein